jgi:hypothetical protein
MSKIVLTDEASTPATPASGTTVLYTQGGFLYVLNDGGTTSSPINSSIFTATGQLLYASGASTPAALPIGTTGQFLGVSGGGIPAWTTLFSTTLPAALGLSAAAGTSTEAAHQDHVHALPVSALGDLMYASSASTVTNLPIGTANQFLRVNGGATAPEWDTIGASDVGAVPSSTVTTAGDLIYGTGAGTVTRRGIGTAGQVLTVNSGATAPEWVSPPTFVAGTSNSTAQYRGATAIQDAITAAGAAITGGLAAATVVVLPGSYTESLTLSKNVSLVASGGFGSTLLTGNITCTADSGTQVISGLYVQGYALLDNPGGATTTASLYIANCAFQVSGAVAPISVSDSGWEISLERVTIRSTNPGTAALSTGTFEVRLTAIGCELNTSAGFCLDGSFTEAYLEKCSFNMTLNLRDTTGLNSINVKDCSFGLNGGPSQVFLFPGSAAFSLNLSGSLSTSGLAAAGTLYTVLGAATVNLLATAGTFLGSYPFANLPVLTGGSPDGCLAYATDENALYVRRSAAWAKVASTSSDNTWNASGGQQTFYTTQFNRAAIPDAVNGGASYNLVDTSAPLVRMETAGSAKTVALFSPVAGDVGKQWVVFDAARDASGAGPITISLLVGTDTLNGSAGGTATISTDGGALVVRVSAANSWETLGY